MSKLLIISLILKYSAMMHIDPNIALAVAQTESKLNPNAIGKLHEIGLYQIRSEYSAYTKEELFDPELNIMEGIRMIKEAKRTCKHQAGITFLICFNAGHTAANKIKHPHQFPYVKAIHKQMLLTRLEYQ